MEARMKNPATVLDATSSIQGIYKSIYGGGVAPRTVELVHLRASQINSCDFCVDAGTKSALKAGETEQRIAALADWRTSPLFADEAERAALELTESATRLADRTDAVPDEVWNAAAKHYDEKGLAALVLMIALTNLFNRLNVTTRQVPGQW